MKWTYRCPHCRAHLNPGESAIILSATGDAGRGLFLFNAAPGDYELVLPEGIVLEKGQKWEFSCPICRENLTSAADGNIATIRLFDEEGKEHAVFFSKIAGEHCTFVVNAEGVSAYGPHANQYEQMVWAKYF